jgi:hypothetical protein
MAMPCLARAHFLYCPERAMGHSSGFLWPHISHHLNVHKVVEERVNADAPGIFTSANKKTEYAISTLFHIKEGHLRIARDLVCSNERMKQGNSAVLARDRPAVILQQLRDQLMRYRQIESDTTDPIGVTRKSLSGVADRHGKKDPSAKDDLVFCFTFCVGAMDMIRERRIPLVKEEWLPPR